MEASFPKARFDNAPFGGLPAVLVEMYVQGKTEQVWLTITDARRLSKQLNEALDQYAEHRKSPSPR